MKILRTIAAALVCFTFAGNAHSTILISGTSISNFAINDPLNSQFLAILNAASGNDLAFVADMSNPAQVAGADALYIATRAQGDVLSAAELANIAAFISTGKRVFLGGENNNWATWNNSILSLVGGTYVAGNVSTTLLPVAVHPLTAGLTSVDLANGSSATGGLSLFDFEVANLWGAGQNVLTLQDANMFQNARIGLEDNEQFANNVAAWLAASAPSQQVSEPGMLALFGLGLLGLGLVRRKRRSV